MTNCGLVPRFPLLVRKFASPLYTALMVWLPTAIAEIGSVAVPLLSDTVPSGVEPSLKVTVPVAVEGVTVAVNVTVWPNTEGLTDDVTATAELL